MFQSDSIIDRQTFIKDMAKPNCRWILNDQLIRNKFRENFMSDTALLDEVDEQNEDLYDNTFYDTFTDFA